MTAKRFTTDYKDFLKEDMTFIKNNDKRMTFQEVVDLLNELHEEVQAQSIVIKRYQERNDGLFKENEQLRKEVQGFIKGIQDSSRISAEAIVKGMDQYDM